MTSALPGPEDECLYSAKLFNCNSKKDSGIHTIGTILNHVSTRHDRGNTNANSYATSSNVTT